MFGGGEDTERGTGMAVHRPRPEAQTTLLRAGQEDQAREPQEIARPEVYTTLQPVTEAARAEQVQARARPALPETHTTLTPASPPQDET